MSQANGLSVKAKSVLDLDAAAAYQSFVVRGPGHASAGKILATLAPVDLLERPPRDLHLADALLSGLWLWHDFLHESHAISQKNHSATGSFWHAIMHRREGDFWNSKYWLKRCPNHPAIELIRQRDPAYEPFRFVDQCEQASENANHPDRAKLIALQKLEWKVLFDWCLERTA